MGTPSGNSNGKTPSGKHGAAIQPSGPYGTLGFQLPSKNCFADENDWPPTDRRPPNTIGRRPRKMTDTCSSRRRWPTRKQAEPTMANPTTGQLHDGSLHWCWRHFATKSAAVDLRTPHMIPHRTSLLCQSLETQFRAGDSLLARYKQ